MDIVYYNTMSSCRQHVSYQCLIVFAIIKKHVTTCIATQNVLRNNAILASRNVKIGTSGLSLSELPIKWPVALAQTRSILFNLASPHAILYGLL
jgi:hypothetical protein